MGISWDKIDLDKNEVRLSSNLNGLTLSELNFRNNERIQVFKKKQGYVSRVDLIDDKGELVDRAKSIFEKWFGQYCHDGLMSQADCATFIASCTNEPCPQTDNRIANLFQRFDEDQDGYLNKQDFLSKYILLITHY